MAFRTQISSILLIINLIISIICTVTLGAAVSSKIDLDENDETTPPATLSSSVLKAFVDINQPASTLQGTKTSRITEKPSRGFRQSGRRPTNNREVNDDEDENNDYISIEDLFKKRKQQLQQNPIGATFLPSSQGFYGEPDIKPTIINNIHVTINANDSSGPGINGCKNGVCDIRVSSKPDDDGNVITNVHLSVVTKLHKPRIQVADIPVIEGTSGTKIPQFDQLPAFHFVDQNVRYGGGSLFANDIPQLPIHRQDVDSWYHQPPTIFERPRPVWHYGRGLDQGFKYPQNSQPPLRSWMTDTTRGRGIVDDKIEPPLSKTKPTASEVSGSEFNE